jgi:LmbE family N-acetylglucosaminyl deacetylase
MVIVAHPDDAEFLCGGTIAKLCAEGWEVSYLLTTSGDMGTRDDKMSRSTLAAIREKEQVAAADTLGAKEVIFLRYPDGFYWAVDAGRAVSPGAEPAGVSGAPPGGASGAPLQRGVAGRERGAGPLR